MKTFLISLRSSAHSKISLWNIYFTQVALKYNLNPFLKIYNFLRVIKCYILWYEFVEIIDISTWFTVFTWFRHIYILMTIVICKKNCLTTFQYYVHPRVNRVLFSHNLIGRVNRYLTQWIHFTCVSSFICGSTRKFLRVKSCVRLRTHSCIRGISSRAAFHHRRASRRSLTLT